MDGSTKASPQRLAQICQETDVRAVHRTDRQPRPPPPVAVRSRATRVLGFVDFWGTRDVEIRSSCQIVYVSVFVGLNDPWWCPVVFGLVDIGPWPNTRVSTDQPLLCRTTVTSENR